MIKRKRPPKGKKKRNFLFSMPYEIDRRYAKVEGGCYMYIRCPRYNQMVNLPICIARATRLRPIYARVYPACYNCKHPVNRAESLYRRLDIPEGEE